MDGEVRGAARWAVAFCVSGALGMVLITTMFRLGLAHGLRGVVLWLLVAAVTAGFFTAVLDGPGAMLKLFHRDPPN